jgi:hypothetical protein
MANTTIKITQLPSIGNALSASTVLPVVDTSGVAVTAKVTAGNIANYTLTEAGNLLPPALLANLAYSVVNAAQPNITSVGTLNINTLTISGGTDGQYLQTDGSGNLSWVSGGGSGNGEVGGSNTEIQFNDAGNFGGAAGFTFDKTSNVLTVPGNIDVSTLTNSGTITIDSDGTVWTFATDGSLTLPGGIVIGNSDDRLTLNDNFSIGAYSNTTRLQPTQTDATVEIATLATGNMDPSIWTFDATGGTIFPTLTTQRGDNPSGTIQGQTLLFGDSTQEAIISTPNGTSNINSSQRLVINPGQGFDGGEGGDIYLWAGRGGPTNGSGGDIKIRGGQGMADGTGGYIRIEAGDSQANGYPGYIDITGGSGGNAEGGYVHLTGGTGATAGGPAVITGGYGSNVGGDANIVGGYGGTNQGGNINITAGGSALGLAGYGNVNISAGASSWVFGNDGNLTAPSSSVILPSSGTLGIATNDGNTYAWVGTDGFYIDTLYNTDEYEWHFDNTGNLSLPLGGSIFSVNTTPSGNPGNTITLQPAGSGVTTNQKLLVYPTAADGDHIHMTSGNLYETELFLGSDNLYVKLANTGNVVINSNDSNGNTAMWTFGIDGNLAFPAGSKISNGYPGLAQDGSSWFITPSGGSGGLVSADGEQYIQVNDNSEIYIGTGWPDNNYEWTFGRDGNLTIPGNILVSGSASPAPRISGFDSATFATRVTTTPVSYSALTTVAGSRAFINNANLVAAGNFGAQVSGGGSNTVPVWCDGTNWYIG